MDGERFDLYFGSLKVGTVAQADSDFPNLWGTITYEPWVSIPKSPGEERFARFLALNKESTRLVDMEPEMDTSREQVAVAVPNLAPSLDAEVAVLQRVIVPLLYAIIAIGLVWRYGAANLTWRSRVVTGSPHQSRLPTGDAITVPPDSKPAETSPTGEL